jgi:adenine-specific DNA-methyltransferase
MTDLNDLLVTSPDLNKERLEALKRLFPDLFINEGKLNPVELRRLFEDEATTDKEHYAFTWKGKGKAKRHAFTPSRASLTYDPGRSVNPDKADGNLIIEGENLEVLKLLTSAYREQVKCIYIDPPYNTGGDFIYPDNYTKSRKEYWEENGTFQDGVKLDTNTEASGRYHSDWLSMVYSRLLVARQLLRDDGAIFVSIDDHEVHNLRKLLDEVFGEENFIAQLPWKGRGGGADDHNLLENHEYVILYAKDAFNFVTGRKIKTGETFPKYDEHKKRNYKTQLLRKWGSNSRREDRPNLYYPIKTYSGIELYPTLPDGSDGCWRWSQERMQYALNNKDIDFVQRDDGSWEAYEKIYEPQEGEVRTKLYSAWLQDELSEELSDIISTNDPRNTAYGTKVLKNLFEGKSYFDYPKPPELIKVLTKICNLNGNDIVLDFFAGSGTTAQAVMELNKEDGENRQFLLVQLPEAIDEKKEAYKAGYRTISQITIERNKRVIEGYGDDPQPLDTGFKVYKLTKSYFPRAEFQPDPDKSNEENVELLKKYIAEKEASFHMAFEQDKVFDEVLLKNGFKLDYKLTKQEEFEKNTVYLAEESDRKAYVCLDTTIANETIDFFKTHKDIMFICLERALDTTRKWNLNHTLGERLKAL